jgi:nucleotide-binding universal stress UspA family protein
MDSALLSLISACTALVASIAGPFVTLIVAKRNFNATVLSANRQKWIESLRDTLAELISLLIAALFLKEKWKGKWDRGRGALIAEPALLDKVQSLVLAQSKVRLLLNPTEADHQHLYRAIESASKRLQSEEALESETEADIETITTLAQTILKREWQRVKHGT